MERPVRQHGLASCDDLRGGTPARAGRGCPVSASAGRPGCAVFPFPPFPPPPSSEQGRRGVQGGGLPGDGPPRVHRHGGRLGPASWGPWAPGPAPPPRGERAAPPSSTCVAAGRSGIIGGRSSPPLASVRSVRWRAVAASRPSTPGAGLGLARRGRRASGDRLAGGDVVRAPAGPGQARGTRRLNPGMGFSNASRPLGLSVDAAPPRVTGRPTVPAPRSPGPIPGCAHTG